MEFGGHDIFPVGHLPGDSYDHPIPWCRRGDYLPIRIHLGGFGRVCPVAFPDSRRTGHCVCYEGVRGDHLSLGDHHAQRETARTEYFWLSGHSSYNAGYAGRVHSRTRSLCQRDFGGGLGSNTGPDVLVAVAERKSEAGGRSWGNRVHGDDGHLFLEYPSTILSSSFAWSLLLAAAEENARFPVGTGYGPHSAASGDEGAGLVPHRAR